MPVERRHPESAKRVQEVATRKEKTMVFFPNKDASIEAQKTIVKSMSVIYPRPRELMEVKMIDGLRLISLEFNRFNWLSPKWIQILG